MIPKPPHDLVQAVQAELATPGRYHLVDQTHAVRRSWLQVALQFLFDRYAEFVHALASHLKVGPNGVSLLGDAVVVMCVVVLGVVGARLLIGLQVDRTRASRAIAIGPPRSAHAIARAAADAAASGDFARAIRLLFTASVTLLDLRGVLHDDPSATVNDLRRALRARNARAEAPFVEIARMFSAAAYAEEHLDASAWEAARTAYDRLSSVATAA
ncbi:MAG: hypothetical protein JO322_16565 [Candidatus Eremiobacteraeota bacterium]|nr:hypothetical protein [Candidatus Eremiobacteraeota bacterium]